MITVDLYWFTDSVGIFSLLVGLSAILVVRSIYRTFMGN